MKNKFKILCGLTSLLPISTISLTSCSQKIIYKNEVQTNFGGHYAFNYGNISESSNDVHIEVFSQKPKEKWFNNPNFGQAMLLNQCINYKKKHLDKEVEIAISSFHFSYMAGACIDKTNSNFGKMREMRGADEDNNGYVRISYLLIKAAKAGINVYAVGQIPAKYEPEITEEENFEQYFLSHMGDLCDDGIHTVKDYLIFKRCKWTGYGEKAGSDLMHLKNCTVTAYTDDNGVDHDGAIYTSSANMDAIKDNGEAGNNLGQTGVIVSDHPKLAQCFLNYTKILTNCCEMEDAARFREKIWSMNVAQIDVLTVNPESTIENQIVYLGSNKDKIFELYFTPFGGSTKDFDIKYNPFAKHIYKFANASSGSKLSISWVNSNFRDETEYSKIIMNLIDQTLYKSNNINNKLIFGFKTGEPDKDFSNLIEGINIGVKSINRLNQTYHLHCKELTLKYDDFQQTNYVTMLNTINFHTGANFYQANSMLVIKETSLTHNSVYVNINKFITKDGINEKELI